LVILKEGVLIGAAWTRVIKGYGNVDSQTPELSMAIKSAYQGKGYGGDLLRHLLALLQVKEYRQVSLSVDNRNRRALALYRRHNFKTFRQEGHTVVMVCDLTGLILMRKDK